MGPVFKEAAELAIPEEEADPRYAGMSEDDLFRMPVELQIEADQFGQGEKGGQQNGDPPADTADCSHSFPNDPVQQKAGSNGDQDEGPLGHDGTRRQQ